MTLREAENIVQQTVNKMRLIRIVESVLTALSVGLIVFAIAVFFFTTSTAGVLGALSSTVVAFVIGTNKLRGVSTSAVFKLLHVQFPVLEDSADLLILPSEKLTTVQQIQQQNILEQFDGVSSRLRIPNSFVQRFVWLTAAIIATTALLYIPKNAQQARENTKASPETEKKIIPAKLPPAIEHINITVTPPAYTQIAPTHPETPNLVVPEGSVVQWDIEFSSDVTTSNLQVSTTTKIKPIASSGKTFRYRYPATNTTFYNLLWAGADGGEKSSDYFKLEVIKDKPPVVEITSLRQSTTLSVHDKMSIPINTLMHDDYGISDAYLIATVSKGSGESVKFREEKIRFSNPKKFGGKQFNATASIDLHALKMEPGDELYLYAGAIDNRTPKSNSARTETYFITLLDTASQTLAVEGGLGVDLMPDYFRSQRQIIIDTEKLLKDRKKLKKQEFNSTSNELGYDQKVLRLKYGEFLGEEFETRIGEAAPPDEDETVEDVAKKFTHAHDTENEHNLVEEKKDNHDHADKGKDAESIADQYKHQHDDAEEATFFNQSIRSKLKAALTEMWDAELYLRLYQPEKSLPYQYKALKLLKEISNDSRIYVHKTGFDPPPLKEEKRLTGELSEIKSTNGRAALLSPESQSKIRKALQLTETRVANPKPAFDERDKAILMDAGNELAVLAIQRPEVFLAALSTIKQLTSANTSTAERSKWLFDLRKYLWLALKEEKMSANSERRTAHALDDAFLKTYEKLNNE